LVRGLPQAVLGLGPQGEVVQMNPAAGRLLGAEPEQAVGRKFSQVFAGQLEQGEELFRTIASAQAKGKAISGLVVPLTDSKGTQRYVWLSITPLSGGGTGVAMADVSQQERTRREQQHQKAQVTGRAALLEKEIKRLDQRLRQSSRLRLWAALVVILLFAGAGWYAWTRTHQASQTGQEFSGGKQGGQAAIYTVRTQPLSYSISLSGTIEPFETINLLSPFGGRILQRHFDYGQKVPKGHLLLKLDTSELEMKLRDAEVAAIKAQENYHKLKNWKNSDTVLQAQRQLNKALNNLEVTQQKLQESRMLYKRGIIPLDEYRSLKEQVDNQKISLATLKDQLRAAIDKGSALNLKVARLQRDNARAKLARLQRQIKQSRITAPVVGVVIRPSGAHGGKQAKTIEVGYEVARGQVLLALGNLERLTVVTHVGELNVAKLRKGQRVTITSYAFPGLALKGRINTVSSQASPGSDAGPPTFLVKVATDKLTPEQQGKLRLGMSADLRVQILSRPKALVVPIDAVRSGPQGGRVLTLALPGGGTKQVPVKTGLTTPDMVEITSGLKPGDRVVLPAGPAAP
jgi:RND family efflux transporter MFP subunit